MIGNKDTRVNVSHTIKSIQKTNAKTNLEGGVEQPDDQIKLLVLQHHLVPVGVDAQLLTQRQPGVLKNIGDGLMDRSFVIP